MPTKTHLPLDADLIRAILDYDPATGIFRWKRRKDVPARWNTRYAGKIAGHRDRVGYIKIQIGKRMHYCAHVLAWLYVYGDWRPNEIDHKEGDRSDNRIESLRIAGPSGNATNKAMQRNNRSGYVGVHFENQRGRWEVVISQNGRRVWRKFFDTADAANEARKKAVLETHGEFAPANPARPKYRHHRDLRRHKSSPLS